MKCKLQKTAVKPRQANAVQEQHECYHNSMIEGSLETTVPTTWTDEKHSQEEAEPGRSIARKKLGRGESQKGEDKRWRKSEERRCRCAKR